MSNDDNVTVDDHDLEARERRIQKYMMRADLGLNIFTGQPNEDDIADDDEE